MQWWIQTRGRTTDYRFLGEEGEPERWWAPYLRLAAPEDRMLVVQTGAVGWWLYATAMPSGRFDTAAPPRAIRNSLVVRGGPGEARFLGQVIPAYFSGELADLLREHIGQEDCGAWLDAAAIPLDVRRSIEAALLDLGEEVAADVCEGTWTGSTDSPGAQRRLAAIARGAAEAGLPCVAGQLNLMSEVSEALALVPVRGAATRVFLLEDGSDTLVAVQEGPRPRGENPTGAGVSPGTSAGRKTGEETPEGMLWILLLIWEYVFGTDKRSSGGE